MTSPEPNIKCLGCGQVVLGDTVINRMADGSSCRHCVERVLDAQPSLLSMDPEQLSQNEDAAKAPILYFPAPNAGWDDPEPA